MDTGSIGPHRMCLLQAVEMCKQTIMDLLTTTVQQWICSSCRHTEDHQAMLSSQPSCSCGISLEETVGIYSRMWMDGLARKYGGKVLTQTEMTNDTPRSTTPNWPSTCSTHTTASIMDL